MNDDVQPIKKDDLSIKDNKKNSKVKEDDHDKNPPIQIAQLLEGVSEDKRGKIMELIGEIYKEESVSFSGPLPHPQIVKGYEKILPGAAERLFKMVEQEQAHRFKEDDKIISSNLKENHIGQILGSLLCFLLIIVALVLGLYNHDWLAGIILTTTILGLATIFVLKKRYSSQEEKESDENSKDIVPEEK